MSYCATGAAPPRAAAHRIPFAYSGSGILSIIGPCSGLRYIFAGRGSVVTIDSRDAARLRSIPGLGPQH